MSIKISFCFLFLLCNVYSNGQSIDFYFPAFHSKTFDFVIFQGNQQITVQSDTIPKDGHFTLNIPSKYAPYTGMSRWLITNTQEGGGLDMAIPGHGFKVSCESSQPNEQNITWDGYDAMNELNRIYRIQQKIIDRYELVTRGLQLYSMYDSLFHSFQNEKSKLELEYSSFHKELENNTNYNARFLPIVNLTRGYTDVLTDDEKQKVLNFNDYFTNRLNFDVLYTSGHWTGVIQSWVQLHADVLNNKVLFLENFNTVSKKIIQSTNYTDFVGKVTYYLKLYGKDDFINAIASTVLHSNKITSYDNETMQVYLKSLEGSIGQNLVLPKYNNIDNKVFSTLKSNSFAYGKYNKTLLVFYHSGCGSCEKLIEDLKINYSIIQSNKIRVIAIAADESENEFTAFSRDFPWSDTYCDFKGTNGPNFKNYAVVGTPTIFLIDKQGKIELSSAQLTELLARIKVIN